MSDLPKRMKAVVAYKKGDYRLEEVDVPRAGEKELIIKVEACGVCAGDLKAYGGAPSFWGGEGSPPYIKAPMIPGHEFLGEVVEVGEGAEGFSIGDRVVSEQIVPCGECRYCREGSYWMCQKHDVYGFQYNVNGGMAEYMRLPKEAINYKISKELPLEKAVLIEPFACSKHCVDRAQIKEGDIVVLSGAGTLGLGMIAPIKMRKPGKLIVLDLMGDRLELAAKFGADIVLNPAKDDLAGIVDGLSDGYGCDVYIEATGHPASVQQGLQIIRKMGTFVEFSVFKDMVVADWSIISDRKELNLYGAHLSPDSYPDVIRWISDGTMPTEGVVTHKFTLDQWKDAFDVAAKGAGSIKVIIVP